MNFEQRRVSDFSALPEGLGLFFTLTALSNINYRWLLLKFSALPEQKNSLQQERRRKINRPYAGVNGELSHKGLARLETLLELHKPQLLLLCHGANDMLQKHDLNIMADNLKEMIRLATARKIQVVLIAVPRPSLILSPIKQYQQVADDMQVLIENDILTNVLQQPQYHSDIIHPNHLGYQKIALAIAALLDKHGAIAF
jgi:acyl-CoA thioesterase I